MKKVFLVALTGLMMSCAGKARVVSEVPKASGVIAIKNRNHKKSRIKAEEFMAQNCSPQAYKIVEEGEQIKGDVIYRDGFGGIHKDPKKEWMIRYKCAPVKEKASKG